jgi:hypothetical protein
VWDEQLQLNNSLNIFFNDVVVDDIYACNRTIILILPGRREIIVAFMSSYKKINITMPCLIDYISHDTYGTIFIRLVNGYMYVLQNHHNGSFVCIRNSDTPMIVSRFFTNLQGTLFISPYMEINYIGTGLNDDDICLLHDDIQKDNTMLSDIISFIGMSEQLINIIIQYIGLNIHAISNGYIHQKWNNECELYNHRMTLLPERIYDIREVGNICIVEHDSKCIIYGNGFGKDCNSCIVERFARNSNGNLIHLSDIKIIIDNSMQIITGDSSCLIVTKDMKCFCLWNDGMRYSEFTLSKYIDVAVQTTHGWWILLQNNELYLYDKDDNLIFIGCDILNLYTNGYVLVTRCINNTILSWGPSDYGGDTTDISLCMISYLESIIVNVQKHTF